MFKENIIKLQFCTFLKMPAFRIDKFSLHAGLPCSLDKYMVKQHYSLVNLYCKAYCNHPLGLTLSTPGLVMILSLPILDVNLQHLSRVMNDTIIKTPIQILRVVISLVVCYFPDSH